MITVFNRGRKKEKKPPVQKRGSLLMELEEVVEQSGQ